MMNRYLLSFILLTCSACTSSATATFAVTDTSKSLYQYVLKDSTGSDYTLEQLKDKYIFLEIWSMSCVPCLREMPFVDQLRDIYKDKPIEFVAVCVENNVNLWRGFIQKKQMNGRHLVTPLFSPFLKEQGFIAVPRYALLDKKGNVVWSRAKRPSDPQLRIELDKLFQ